MEGSSAARYIGLVPHAKRGPGPSGVVVVRRCLVVANRTLLGAELRAELRKRIEAGASSFYLLVPNTSAADYHAVTEASGVLPPSLAWWATDYRGPATDQEAT